MSSFGGRPARQRTHSLRSRGWSLVATVALVLAGMGIATPALASGSPIVGLAGKCVDVTSGVSSNGTPIVLWSCHGGANQAWSVPGDDTLRSLNKCLDVRWGSTSPGAPVQLWDCNGSGAQQWVVNGMNLVNPRSRLCLDVPGSNSADGARL